MKTSNTTSMPKKQQSQHVQAIVVGSPGFPNKDTPSHFKLLVDVGAGRLLHSKIIQ